MKVPPTFALLLIGAASLLQGATAPVAPLAQPGLPDHAPEGVAKSDWQGIQAAHQAWQHQFHAVDGGHVARTPGQQWNSTFDTRGFLTRPDGAAAESWSWGLELESYGFAGAEQRLDRQTKSQPHVAAEGQRLTRQWDASLQEWYVNDFRGLEHGFTIAQRPSGGSREEEPLLVTLAVRGTLKPSMMADAQGVEFHNDAGSTVLNYSGLKVWDADGKILAARFEETPAGSLRLQVEESAARYPITIDPLAQQAYLKASNNGAQTNDNFGIAVAVSGDTVVIGANMEDSGSTGVNSAPDESAIDAGAAYVFVRSAGTWTQQAYLKPAAVGTTQAGDQFGYSVAISGDMLVVGACYEGSESTGINSTATDTINGTSAGAAYVFARSGGIWTQQAYLKPAAVGSSQVGDLFGSAVGISGDTVIVGAPSEKSSSTGVNSMADENAAAAGAAYVFTRTTGVWAQEAYLKPATVGTSQSQDQFGISVAISGEMVVIGAPNEDSNTTGINSGPDESGPNAGAAYVFARDSGTWSQQAYLKPAAFGTRQDFDNYGTSVAISGDTVVVGAPGERSTTSGIDTTPNEDTSESGATYVYVRSGVTWSQQAYVKATRFASVGGGGDRFGISVAISDNSMVVGATGEDGGSTVINTPSGQIANGSGAAYVFMRSGVTWSQQAYLKPAAVGSTQANDSFGRSVAIAGETVVAGANAEDSSTTGVNSAANENADGAGAAYVFSRDAGSWSQKAYLKASNTESATGPTGPGVGDQFGASVAISGNTLVVGAPREDSNTTGINTVPNESATNAGAAYIFVRSGGGWSQQAYLKPALAGSTQAGDSFGISVSISGNTVVVGASGEDSGTTIINEKPGEDAHDAGAAFVFVRNGDTWSEQARLKPGSIGSTQAGDGFGTSVSISGETIVVGAPNEDSYSTGINSGPDETSPNAGAAHIFVRKGIVWTREAYLKPAAVGSTQAGDQFGISVAIAGDTVVVGASGEDSSSTGINSTPNESSLNAGSAYVFERSGTLWSQVAYLKPDFVGSTQAGDQFGTSVALSKYTVVVGAPGEDSSATTINGTRNESASNAGAAYTFGWNGAWYRGTYLKPTSIGNTPAGDQFGISVGISDSGKLLVVGAHLEDSSSIGIQSTPDEAAASAGAAYVFESYDSWRQRAYLKPTTVGTTQAGDNFGRAVAISDDTVVVGAPLEDSGTKGAGSAADERAIDSGASWIFTVTLGPEISVRHPVSVDLTSGGAPIGFGLVAQGGSSEKKTFTIYNKGPGPLAITQVSVTGGSAADFSVDTTSMLTSLPASAGGITTSTTFMVTFTPGSNPANHRSTTLRIVSDDLDEGYFDITAEGAGLSLTNDSDGDGLNDASEFKMAALGFDWQVNQAALVSTLTSNLNGAGYYTPSQVQALNLPTPLIQRDAATGTFTLTIGLEKSTTLAPGSFSPFPFTSPQTTVNAQGMIEFRFSVPDDAAFFQLRTE